jgi:hypothetical protein
MPNLLLDRYNEVKRLLIEIAHHAEQHGGGYGSQQSQRIHETVKSFTDGLTGMLNNCQKLFEAHNKGHELQAEARRALASAQGYYRKIEELAHIHEVAELDGPRIGRVSTLMGELIRKLNDYATKGMTVEKNYFRQN